MDATGVPTADDAQLWQDRAHRFGLLRWGWLPHDRRAWAVVSSEQWYTALEQSLAEAGISDEDGVLDRLAKAAGSLEDQDEWEAAYVDSFGRRVRASPNETDYTATHATQQSLELADIAGFYKAFGLRTTENLSERVDHMGAELEFLHQLAHRRWKALQRGDDEGGRICAEAYGAFIEDHTGRWVGRLHEVALTSGAHPFFAELVELVRLVVDAEIGVLRLEPQPPPVWAGSLLDTEGDLPGCEGSEADDGPGSPQTLIPMPPLEG